MKKVNMAMGLSFPVVICGKIAMARGWGKGQFKLELRLIYSKLAA